MYKPCHLFYPEPKPNPCVQGFGFGTTPEILQRVLNQPSVGDASNWTWLKEQHAFNQFIKDDSL